MSTSTNIATSFKQELFMGGHCFLPTITPTATLTNGSTLVSVPDVDGIAVGMSVSGTNISTETFVVSIGSDGFTMSNAATADSNETITLSGDIVKMCLLVETPTGSYGATTTNYSEVVTNGDEVSSSGYTAGGMIVNNVAPIIDGTTICASWSNPTWDNVAFTTSACMLYNSSNRLGMSGRCIAIYSFGSAQTVDGSFEVILPLDTASAATVRII